MGRTWGARWPCSRTLSRLALRVPPAWQLRALAGMPAADTRIFQATAIFHAPAPHGGFWQPRPPPLPPPSWPSLLEGWPLLKPARPTSQPCPVPEAATSRGPQPGAVRWHHVPEPRTAPARALRSWVPTRPSHVSRLGVKQLRPGVGVGQGGVHQRPRLHTQAPPQPPGPTHILVSCVPLSGQTDGARGQGTLRHLWQEGREGKATAVSGWWPGQGGQRPARTPLARTRELAQGQRGEPRGSLGAAFNLGTPVVAR